MGKGRTCARGDLPEAFGPADRLLLTDIDWHAHDHRGANCHECGLASCCVTTELARLADVLFVALAHGHAVTLVPHAETFDVAVEIHPRECECGAET